MTDEEINIAIAKEAGFSVFTPKIILSEYFLDYGYSIKNHQEVDKEICYMLAKSGIHEDHWGGHDIVTFLLKDGLICVRSVTRKNELIAPGKNIPSFTRSEIPVYIKRNFIQKEEYKNGFQVDDFAEYLPDYCNNLDAMHEAEKLLETADQQNRYYAEIADITWCNLETGNRQVVFNQLTATAHQRAEAFLRTLNLWVE